MTKIRTRGLGRAVRRPRAVPPRVARQEKSHACDLDARIVEVFDAFAEELLEAGPRQGLERAVVVAADNELAPMRMRRLWAIAYR